MKSIAGLFALLLSANTFAGCYKIDWDQPPAIPDGATATTSEMLDARDAVITFVRDGERFLDCGNSEPFVHNIIAHQLEVTAAQFNEQRQRFLEQRSSVAAN